MNLVENLIYFYSYIKSKIFIIHTKGGLCHIFAQKQNVQCQQQIVTVLRKKRVYRTKVVVIKLLILE